MLPVGDQVREAVEQGFEGLIGGDDIVETHERDRVLHPRVVGVKGDDVGHPHPLELLQ